MATLGKNWSTVAGDKEGDMGSCLLLMFRESKLSSRRKETYYFIQQWHLLALIDLECRNLDSLKFTFFLSFAVGVFK